MDVFTASLDGLRPTPRPTPPTDDRLGAGRLPLQQDFQSFDIVNDEVRISLEFAA